jgi:cysteine synthase
MAEIAGNLCEPIGSTPAVRLNRFARELPGERIVTIICDTGERHLSTTRF